LNDNNQPNNNNQNSPKNNKSKKKRSKVFSIIIGALIALLVWNWVVFPMIDNKNDQENTKTYNEFMALVENGDVEEVNYDSSHKDLEFKLKDDDTIYSTANPKVNTFKKDMLERDIVVNEVNFDGETFFDTVKDVFFLILQYGLMMGMFLIIFKKMQGGADEMSIETSSTNKFADVAGLEEVKESMLTTVDMLKNPKKYSAAGARIPKGTLLYGPPGTGKTLLAKAIAGEAGVNFLAVNGADFDNKYVGVGADKVRKIFEKAKKLAPCIIFIDELDAIGCKRSSTDKAYERQTLNQLLSCMDGFSADDGVFIFAATNDIESLDPALLRPGRFDARFAVGLPDTTKDRVAIINLYTKNKKLADSVSVETIAKQTLGCSPAAIEAIINDAAIESVQNGGIITQRNIDDAFYRQIMDGHKKKNTERNQKEIQTVAWHEAGHALIGYLQNEEVAKVSITASTTGVGGMTLFDQKKFGMHSKEELENHIRTLYAGRNAEILLNGEAGITTGASNDIKEATKYIKSMVSLYGMSKYGLLNLNEINVPMEELIEEYQAISKTLEKECMEMLENHKDKLVDLATHLVKKETIDANELIDILQ
jgi:cell division protease FtsH